MFSGIGGFEYGIEQACKNKRFFHNRPLQQNSTKRSETYNINQNKLFEWQCVGRSEIDEYADAVYRFKYPSSENYGDATKIIWSKVRNFDMLVGGFPCQAFSIAGKRLGFEDARGTLFFELARCLKEKCPPLFLFENVKGLLSHDNGRTFKTIISTLAELGYSIEWQVLNSKNFGVPQNRERVFIIGYLAEKSRTQIFPIEEINATSTKINIAIKDKFQKSVYNPNGISSTVREGHGDVIRIINDPSRRKNPTKNDIAPTLRSECHGNLPSVIMRDGRDNRSCLRSARIPEIGYPGISIRRLTPIECERLQAFPDNWTRYGIFNNIKKEIKDGRRYKMLGNAVTTNVISAIVNKMLYVLR